jgi:hypothetical protein
MANLLSVKIQNMIRMSLFWVSYGHRTEITPKESNSVDLLNAPAFHPILMTEIEEESDPSS